MRMKHYFRSERGAAAIEFALVLPIILLLTFPLIDYARYILLQQKVIKTAYVLGDAITMSRPIDALTVQSDNDPSDGINGIDQDATFIVEELFRNPNGSDLMDNVPTLMLPFTESTAAGSPDFNKFQVIISHILKPDPVSPPQITWQFNEDDDNFNGTAQSAIGNVPGFGSAVAANLPAELINGMDDREDLIAVEVFANHVPITPNMLSLGINFLGPTTITYTSYMRSRYGDLSYIWDIYCFPINPNC